MSFCFALEATTSSSADGAEHDWTSWAADHRPPARFLSVHSGPSIHQFDSPLRIAGVVVQPADVVLGIRGWEDAFEQTLELDIAERPVPVVVFEIEKIVRMMLHQSGLAFEVLSSPALLVAGEPDGQDFGARRIVEAALTRDIVYHYRDIAGGWLDRLAESRGQGASAVDMLDIFRHALTGLGLMEGRVDFRLWEMAAHHGRGGLEGLLREVERGAKIGGELLDELVARGRQLVAELRPEDAALPAHPSDYEWLDELVVQSRIELFPRTD